MSIDNNVSSVELGASRAAHSNTSPSSTVAQGADSVRPPDWLTLDQVEQIFVSEGLVRTRTLLARYCRQRRLIGVKDAGPNGDEWYVDPVSVPRAIAELKRINRTPATPTEPDEAELRPTETDQAELHSEASNVSKTAQLPRSAKSDAEEPGQTVSDAVEHGQTDGDIDLYSHPHVIRLERQIEQLKIEHKEEVEYWRSEYKQQVKTTQQIQQESFDRLVELQRMVQVGQSETLANVFIRTKEWLLGKAPDSDVNDDESNQREKGSQTN